MTDDAPAVVALGEPLVEFNCVHAGEPQTYLQGFGGDTSNMVIAAARLGARTGYVTCVGDDPFGRMFLRLWETEGVDTRGVAHYANAAAALAPTGFGAVAPLPRDAGVRALLARGS